MLGDWGTVCVCRKANCWEIGMEIKVDLSVQGFVNFVKGLEPTLGGRPKDVYTQLGHPIKFLWANTALGLWERLQNSWVSDGLGTTYPQNPFSSVQRIVWRKVKPSFRS